MGIPNMSLPELRTPQMENPMDQYAKALQIRAMGQQSQLTALQTEQQRQALKDQQAGTAALHEWDGQDPEQLTKLMAQHGASINAVLATKQHFLDTKAKYSQIAKDDAETGAKNLETLKGKNDMMVGALNTVMGTPDEQLVPSLQATAQDLVQRGLLDPQRAQVVQQMAGLPPDQLRQKLKLFEKSFMSDTQQMEQAAKEATTANAQAELPGKVADSAIKTAEADQMKQGALPQNLADMKYRTLQQNIASGQEIGAGDKAFIKAYEKQKLLVPTTVANIRVAGNEQAREYPVINKQTGELEMRNAADINASHGNFAPAGEGAKAMGKTALIEDIRGNIQQVRQSLSNPKMPEFTAGQRSEIALALGGPNPSTAISAAFRGAVLGALTPEQQDYLINLAQLKENAMAMRSVLGAGQGSEDMRAAITATIPGPNTPSKDYAGKQLDKFEAVLNRLGRGVPGMPLKPNAQAAPGTGQATHRFNPATGKIEAIQP